MTGGWRKRGKEPGQERREGGIKGGRKRGRGEFFRGHEQRWCEPPLPLSGHAHRRARTTAEVEEGTAEAGGGGLLWQVPGRHSGGGHVARYPTAHRHVPLPPFLPPFFPPPSLLRRPPFLTPFLAFVPSSALSLLSPLVPPARIACVRGGARRKGVCAAAARRGGCRVASSMVLCFGSDITWRAG
jgi:hypothetical protein